MMSCLLLPMSRATAALGACLLALTALATAAPSTLYFEDNFEGQHFFSHEVIDDRLFSYVDGEYEIDTSQAQTYGQSILLDTLENYSVQVTGRLESPKGSPQVVIEEAGSAAGSVFHEFFYTITNQSQSFIESVFVEGYVTDSTGKILARTVEMVSNLPANETKRFALTVPSADTVGMAGLQLQWTVHGDRGSRSGGIDRAFGISFNYSETVGNPTFLLFLAYERGFYTVLRYANDKTEIIVQPTRTRLVKPGEPTTLRVDNNNGRITFYINGIESGAHQETQLRSGGFGLFATAQTVARFDDFKVYADKRTVAGGFTDEFDGAKVLYEGSWGEVAYRYQGGRYIVDTSGTSYIGLSPFPEPQLNFEFSADVELVSGQPGGGLGLYVRDHANPSGAFNQFRFLVSDGWFAVERSIDDRPLALAQWSESSAVQKRGVNKLRLVCRGQDITFFVNGVEVYRVRDETPHAGAFGFFAAGGMVAAFDNARMVPLQ